MLELDLFLGLRLTCTTSNLSRLHLKCRYSILFGYSLTYSKLIINLICLYLQPYKVGLA